MSTLNEKEKMWALLVNLGAWEKSYTELPFDDDLWDYIVDECEKTGINNIVICIGGGIEFASHPELSLKGAWTRKKLRDEIKRCRKKNINLIPKLNFSTPHNMWMGEYSRMVSTSVYYKVCNDLIKEAYELFEHPKYIHIGMDEEDARHAERNEWAMYRQGELYWHDIRFLVDCVKDTGATPWMWADPLFDHPDDYKKYFEPDEVILSPWYYNAFRKENWTPVSSREVYVAYYNQDRYANMGIQYVEEDPFLVNIRNLAIPLLNDGYIYVPCASVCNKCDCNTSEVVEYFKENTPDNQLLGFITAPWKKIVVENRKDFEDSFRFLKEAKEKYYK